MIVICPGDVFFVFFWFSKAQALEQEDRVFGANIRSNCLNVSHRWSAGRDQVFSGVCYSESNAE